MKFFTKLVSTLLLVVALFTTAGAEAVTAPSVNLTAPIVPPKPLTLKEKSDKYAKQYNVNAELMSAVVKCESTFNPDAIGDYGNSFGLVQIHLPSHPTITKEQAYDPDFALDFLAKNLAKGKGNMWTCYRIVTGQQ